MTAHPDRSRAVAAHPTLNGIETVEVLDRLVLTEPVLAGVARQRTLLVRCFKPLPAATTAAQLALAGDPPVGIAWAHRADALPGALPIGAAERAWYAALPEAARTLVVRVDRDGGFGPYALDLSAIPEDGGIAFDPVLAVASFSFMAECDTRLDCRDEPACPPPAIADAPADAMARDWASFRRLMLDRMAMRMPAPPREEAADLLVTLVEAIAERADRLSYMQDVAGTEAYLGTARLRSSVRRHARLLDYPLGEAINARTVVAFTASGDEAGGAGPVVPAGTVLLTRVPGLPPVLAPASVDGALSAGAIAFETMEPLAALAVARNAMALYAWGEDRACLPRGATEASLEGGAALGLSAGDIVVLEETVGPETGLPQDADPAHRHAVRLIRDPVVTTDPLTGTAVAKVTWASADALPFPLCIGRVAVKDGGGATALLAVARGNAVLADHGLSLSAGVVLADAGQANGAPRWLIAEAPVARNAPFDPVPSRGLPLSAALRPDLGAALPLMRIEGDGATWRPVADLIGADAFTPAFVLETEEPGPSLVRFGDGVAGRVPAAGSGALTHLVWDGPPPAVAALTNPLAAEGGAQPETSACARLRAPTAFRHQERAVTAEDWAEVASRHRDVSRAVAYLRWTGSWHAWTVVVDRRGGLPVDDAFASDLRAFLERFRIAGYDLRVVPPNSAPVEIVATVCPLPGVSAAALRASLLDRFSAGMRRDGTRGFFHPDAFSFGEPLALSAVVAAAMAVPGVSWVAVDDDASGPRRFRRWGRAPAGEAAAGRIAAGPTEIIRCDNDPRTPQNGGIDFRVEAR
jgi:hypothetical protein